MSSVPDTNAAASRWMIAILTQFAALRTSAMALVHPARPAAPVADNPFLHRPRILVVDDCPVNQQMVSALLSRWGITPLVAADGAEAVALACGQDFDLILMDLQMPVLDGLTATTQLRRFEREHGRARAAVVAYTSSLFAADEPLLSGCGFDDALDKPCSLQSLEACLVRWCGHELPAPSH